jgi:hypothetical protein
MRMLAINAPARNEAIEDEGDRMPGQVSAAADSGCRHHRAGAKRTH